MPVSLYGSIRNDNAGLAADPRISSIDTAMSCCRQSWRLWGTAMSGVADNGWDIAAGQVARTASNRLIAVRMGRGKGAFA